jgi:hypothetical protein
MITPKAFNVLLTVATLQCHVYSAVGEFFLREKGASEMKRSSYEEVPHPLEEEYYPLHL